MFLIDEDKSISITRGDCCSFPVTAVIDGEAYQFQVGDVVRFKAFRKKDCATIVLQRDFKVEGETDTVTIALTGVDTKIGDVISKPVDYWYEIELNPDTNPQTIWGYDDDGPKVFKLFPEGKDVDSDDIEVVGRKTLQELVDYALDQANESGAFKGDKGDKGEKGDPGEQGIQGEKGEQGEPGYTPQIGVDYWTPTDYENMVNSVGATFAPVSYAPQTLTKGQQAQARKNIGADVLRVTLTEYLGDGAYTCSHTSDEIYEAVQSDKGVVLVRDDYIYNLMLSTETRAVFGFVDTEDRYFNCFTIHDVEKIAFLAIVEYAQMDGGAVIAGEPTEEHHAANKGYVDKAVKGKSYELIDTFTTEEEGRIQRTQEPDGTPYRFERMYITMYAPNTGGTANNFLYRHKGTVVNQIYMPAVSTAKSYFATEIWQDAGGWRSGWGQWTTNFSVLKSRSSGYEYGFYPDKKASDLPYIDEIFCYASIPAGTEIKIWGVRADA